ncbi:MAG: TIGR00730 family Rossman fold protein [Chitinophagaceae bacterium]
MQNIQSVAVFCGSKSGNNPTFLEQTTLLGYYLGKEKIKLVYGGGSVGLMGAVANAVMENGGEVVGIIPELLVQWEQQHNGITNLIVVDNMHTRKKMMYEMSDAAIILPGGYGTLDELFEMLTWNTLKIHEMKVFILNVDGFYSNLLAHLNTMQEQGFLYDNWKDRMIVCNNVNELTAAIAAL